MGLLNFLGIGKEISEPINAVSKLYTTDIQRLEGEQKLDQILEQPQLAQIEVNKILASSNSIFEAGWEAWIGWISGLCVGLYYLPQITIIEYLWADNCFHAHKVLPFPMSSVDIFHLVSILFGAGLYKIINNKVNGK